MKHTLRVRISTPTEERVIERVLRLRFETTDGLRGVWPGHELAVAVLLPGVLRLGIADGAVDERTEYVATEGGFLRIAPDEVCVAARWASQTTSLPALIERMRDRRRRRRDVEQEARRKAEQHEIATRKALARLQREVHR